MIKWIQFAAQIIAQLGHIATVISWRDLPPQISRRLQVDFQAVNVHPPFSISKRP